MKKFLKPAFILWLSLIVFSCSDDKTEVIIPPDPCAGAQPFKASFTIYEELWYDSLFATEGILSWNNVHFSADAKYNTYSWKIGDDSRIFRDSSIVFSFGEDQLGKFRVRFIATGFPNRLCFPEDDGIDTVIKEFVVVDEFDSPMIGDYRGFNEDNPKDTFVVNIGWVSLRRQGYKKFYYINNINKGCYDIPDTSEEYLPNLEILPGFTSLKFDGNGWAGGGQCKAPIGYAHLTDNFSGIIIDYTMMSNYTSKNPDFTRFKKRYTGWRIK